MRFLRITRLVPSIGPAKYWAPQHRNDWCLTSPRLTLGATGQRYDVLGCQREMQEWQKSDKLKFRRLPTSRPHTCGGVAERFKATVLKTVVRASVPWVRIPLPPPETPIFSYTFSVSANRLAPLIALYNAFCQDFLKCQTLDTGGPCPISLPLPRLPCPAACTPPGALAIAHHTCSPTTATGGRRNAAPMPSGAWC